MLPDESAYMVKVLFSSFKISSSLSTKSMGAFADSCPITRPSGAELDCALVISLAQFFW